MDKTGNNASILKWKNRRLVLNLIHTLKSTSRIELSKLTNLTKPTISTIISDFLDEGIVIETTLSNSNLGRKAIMLEINYSHYFVVSVNINDNILKIGLSDLSSKIHYYEEYFFNKGLGNELFIDTLENLINSFIYSNIPDVDLIIGISISINGTINTDEGYCINHEYLSLKNLNIKNQLEDKLHVPIFIDNSTFSTPLVLLDKYSNFLYLNISNNITISKVIDNKIYRTSSISNGEIDNFQIGQNKYLKNYCTTSALVEKYIKIKNICTESTPNNTDILSLIGKTIELGDIDSINMLKDFCDNLKIFLNNYILIFEPKKIILDGDILILQDYILKTIDMPCLIVNNFDELPQLKGAALLVANEFFNNYI